MARSTKKEFEARVRKVAGLKARNASRSEIVAYGTREWGVNKRQVDVYLKVRSAIFIFKLYNIRPSAL